MKTTKIITTLTALNLILFLSVASIANPYSRHTGDLVKTAAKKEINTVKGNNTENASVATSGNEFSYLRFDVNNFAEGNESSDLQALPVNALRFDANTYIKENDSENQELPIANEFDYLRFDVNNFANTLTADMNEMPVNEFEYLRFDVNQYSGMNSTEIDELPGRENISSVS